MIYLDLVPRILSHSSPLQGESVVLIRTQVNMAENDREFFLQAHITVNQVFMALENITDPLEIDGLFLRLDYLIHTLVNLGNPQTDEIIRQLGEACNELT